MMRHSGGRQALINDQGSSRTVRPPPAILSTDQHIHSQLLPSAMTHATPPAALQSVEPYMHMSQRAHHNEQTPQQTTQNQKQNQKNQKSQRYFEKKKMKRGKRSHD